VTERRIMALLPKVDLAFSRERLGVNAVAAFAAANNLIWRENNIKDVGSSLIRRDWLLGE
jgi:hypothetical protein